MATFPTMGPHFVLKINLTINSWPCTDCAYWRNIYHVTDGINQGGGNKEGNFGSTGDRYPFLALNNENMVFISEKNGQTDPRDLQYPAHLNTKYKIEVHQINVEGKSMYEIFIDDVKEASIENTSPIIVQDAMVYLSANFIDAGDVTTVSASDLMAECPEEFLTRLPVQAIKCRLGQVMPSPPGAWTSEAGDRLFEMTRTEQDETEVLECNLLRRDESGMMVVQLRGGGLNLAEDLLTNGHAVWDRRTLDSIEASSNTEPDFDAPNGLELEVVNIDKHFI